MNILEMSAGREMDALVAEKVMGWKKVALPWGEEVWPREFDGEGRIKSYQTQEQWRPSKDVLSAWEILNHLISKGAEVNIGFHKEWDCSIDYPIGCNWRATAKTAPEAICKAALLAMEGIQE